jgi:putative hydrolase of the HAD superfamily
LAKFPILNELLQYKVVFFDLDNTIYAYEPTHQAALKKALQQFEKDFDVSEESALEYYRKARKTINERLLGQAASHSRLLYFKEMIGSLQITNQYSDALKFEKIYWQHFLSVMTIDQQALKLIKQLYHHKIPLGIITDLTTQIQLQKMKKLKIEKYFIHLITSEEVGIEKPDKAIFNYALQQFNVKASQAVLIGDNIKTDGGSEAAGIKFIQI